MVGGLPKLRVISALLPAMLRAWVSWLRIRRDCAQVAADPASFRAMRRISKPNAQRDLVERHTIAIRALNGATVSLRAGTADPYVALHTFVGQFHLPPPALGAPNLIWDLGANIGLTMLHMATLYPDARVVGVELDHHNAQLAQDNLVGCEERCLLIHAGVWPVDGRLSFVAQPGREAGIRVDTSGKAIAPALSLNSLLARTGPPDYVKMDIEGSEQEVLRQDTEWAQQVASIAVECHPPYGIDDCAQDLTQLGFDVQMLRFGASRRAHDTVIGLSRSIGKILSAS